MSSEFGRTLRVGVFGQSHGAAIGVTIDGLPAGERIDLAELQAFLDRRKPGKSPLSTARKEADRPEIQSGIYNGKTTGTPICAVIRNTNQRSGDYAELAAQPRPGHADYTGMLRYKSCNDPRGGGHFSARLTVALTAAGVVAKKILPPGVTFDTRVAEIGGCTDPEGFDEVLRAAAAEQDSVGGIIECRVQGVPLGLGQPFFDSAESMIAHLLFSVPAVKGVEFGAGFAAAKLRGSQNNDDYVISDGQIRTVTNNAGGILGGITTGMPLIFRAALKPTPSISRPQQSVSLSSGEMQELVIKGRHDPCIVPRAVPVIEAAAAIAIFDMILGNTQTGGNRKWI